MPNIYQTNTVQPEKFPTATPSCSGDIVENAFEIDLGSLPILGNTLAVGDIIEFGVLPADVRASDWILDCDAGGTALAGQIGLMSGTSGNPDPTRTVGTEVTAAISFAAAQFTRAPNGTLAKVAPVSYDRSIGFLVTTASTAQATTGKIRLRTYTKG